MKPTFDIVTIVGAGLLGGSLGLALKANGQAGVVRGVGRRQETLETAKAQGAIDEAHLDLRVAVKDADLIVVCTPVLQTIAQLEEMTGEISPNAVVTDVASTKAAVCSAVRAAWPKPYRFIGSHPMAGSEKFGPEHARADLYDGKVVVVTPTESDDPGARKTIYHLWESLGADVVEMDARVHDGLVARTSHVPHIVAACLSQLAAAAGDDASPVAGSGFRDMTRVAEGRPELWRDICLTNVDGISEALRDLENQLSVFRTWLEDRADEDVEVFFQAGRDARAQVLHE
ncbi:MAG: hypothetical protein AMXMBFR84_03360 [Candidatus Hydrogenedentota bacterium]